MHMRELTDDFMQVYLFFPKIAQERPLPEYPIQGKGHQLPSKLKEACEGMWPDEAYPELKEW